MYVMHMCMYMYVYVGACVCRYVYGLAPLAQWLVRWAEEGRVTGSIPLLAGIFWNFWSKDL